MGKLIIFSMPLQMIRSLTISDIILCSCEGRVMLKSKINLGSSFCFRAVILMQHIRSSCMMILFKER